MMIDIHTHILPPTFPEFKKKFGYGGFMELHRKTNACSDMVRDDGTHFRTIESNCWDASVRIAESDQAGVRWQVLSTVPTLFSYWAKPQDGLEVAEYLNDHIASVVSDHPNRFVGLGTLPMQDTRLAIQELRRCRESLGFCGVEIGTHIMGKNLDEPEVVEVLEAASELDMAVFVHPWDMVGMERMQRYWLPWLVGMPHEVSLAIASLIFGGVLDRLPKLRIAFAHGGGSIASIIGRLDRGYVARPDLTQVNQIKEPHTYLPKIFVDSLVHDSEALQRILAIFGEGRVMLGTDYPFPLGEPIAGQMIAKMGMNEPLKKRLVFDNACAWLGHRFKGNG